MENNSPVKSVRKALALLDHIALGKSPRDGVPLSQLASELDIPLNTAHNLLRALVAGGYVRQNGRGVYAAGYKCAQIGRAARCAEPDFQAAVLAELHRFVELEGEACVCSVLVGGERIMVGSVESTHAVVVSRATVEAIPFFSVVTGRVLAASATPDELAQVIEKQGLPGRYWDGIDTLDALQSALARIREQHWCLVDQPADGLVSIACPVPGPSGLAWGAVGTYAPAYRCDESRQQELLEDLQDLALRIAAAVQGAETALKGRI